MAMPVTASQWFKVTVFRLEFAPKIFPCHPGGNWEPAWLGEAVKPTGRPLTRHPKNGLPRWFVRVVALLMVGLFEGATEVDLRNSPLKLAFHTTDVLEKIVSKWLGSMGYFTYL